MAETRAPARVRVLVADAGLGVPADDPTTWGTATEGADRLRAMGRRMAAFVPDLVVLFDTPFSGARTEAFEAAEALAVELDLRYRVELHLHRGRVTRPGALPWRWYGRVDAGALVLSRYPVVTATWNDAPGRVEPWGIRRGFAVLHIDLGDGVPETLTVCDGACPDAATGLVAARAVCGAASIGARGRLCLEPGAGWSIGRSDTSAPMGPAGVASVRAELSRPQERR